MYVIQVLLVVMVIPYITIATSTCWACSPRMSKSVTVVTVDHFASKTRSPYLCCDSSWSLSYLHDHCTYVTNPIYMVGWESLSDGSTIWVAPRGMWVAGG